MQMKIQNKSGNCDVCSESCKCCLLHIQIQKQIQKKEKEKKNADEITNTKLNKKWQL